MPSPSLYFLAPDLPHPSGGLRVLYRHAQILRSAGHHAFIVHHRPGYRPPFFETTIPILHAPVDIRPRDVLVIPEVEVRAFASLPPGVAKVAYVQTPYFMFRDHSLDPRDRRTPYTSPDLLAAVVVSQDAVDYLRHAFPDLPTYRVRNAIDPRFCPPDSPKLKQLCFMPRKHPEDAQQVLNLLKFRGVLDGWSVIPIHNFPEDRLIETLRSSAVFLSFGHPKGFGLPPAEAMACRCVTVGYHGNGGREYFTPDHGLPIPFGDILPFARAVEHVLRTLDADPAAFDDLTARASEYIRSTYTPANEQSDVLACWSRILANISREPLPAAVVASVAAH